MIRSYLSGWKNSFNYSKKTNRKTFLKFFFTDLFIMGLMFGIALSLGDPIGNYVGGLVLLPYFVIANFPRLGICARRVKDTGKSTNWMLFTFIPIVGWLILLIIFLQESMPETQKSIEQTIPIQLLSNESSQNESSNDIESKIEELNRLKEKGIISDEEYEKMRKKTLGL